MSGNKQGLWDEFCKRFEVLQSCVPLFALDETGHVAQKLIGKDVKKAILVRSSECENQIISATDRLYEDWHSGKKELDGLLYMMGWKDSSSFIPLYIGKAESAGTSDGAFSANLKNLRTNKGFFARWGDNYAYHIGNLSACVLPGHDPETRKGNYEKWARCLFEEGSTRLRNPVYFWTIAWDPSEVGIWEQFGPTALAFLEHFLIAVADGISPSLLNIEGRPRR